MIKTEKKVDIEIGGVEMRVVVDYTCGHPGTREDPPDDAEIEVKTIHLLPLSMKGPDLKDTFEEMGDLSVLEEKVWEKIDNGEEVEED